MPRSRIDFQWDSRHFDAAIRGMRNTIAEGGEPQVVVDATEHNITALNKLADKGADPFVYPDRMTDKISEDLAEAIVHAYNSERKSEKWGAALEDAARDLAQASTDLITSGRLGRNTPEYAAYKERRVLKGTATNKYGTPPPYGILTGRLVESIRGEVKK